jgi:hypothetical protein
MSSFTNKRLRTENPDGRRPDYVGKKRKASPLDPAPVPKTADSIYRDAKAKVAELNLRTQGVWGVELKQYDRTANRPIPVLADTDRNVNPVAEGCLNGISAGSDVNQRDGNKYTIMSIQISGRMDWCRALPVLAVDEEFAEMAVTIALVEDYQSNGAQMVASDCFNFSTTGALATTLTRNIAGESRFKVHKIWKYFWKPTVLEDNTAGATIQNYCEDFSCYLGNLQIPVECKDSNGTIASIGTHSLHLMAFAYAGVYDAGGTFNPFTITEMPRVDYRYAIRFVG